MLNQTLERIIESQLDKDRSLDSIRRLVERVRVWQISKDLQIVYRFTSKKEKIDCLPCHIIKEMKAQIK